jgi:hypothetical protein
MNYWCGSRSPCRGLLHKVSVNEGGGMRELPYSNEYQLIISCYGIDRVISGLKININND